MEYTICGGQIMIKEFKDELQAKAVADSLGLFITKYKGVYLVSNSKEEIPARYNLGYFQKEGVFYDKEVFKENWGFIIIREASLVDASSIELPYNIRDCSCMLWKCTSLKVPPIIPEGVKDCSYMFCGCTSLGTPPIIPEGVKNCSCMFESCISLEIPPNIPESVKDCTCIFSNCKSLKEPPHFPEDCDTYKALDGTPFTKSRGGS